MTLSDVFRTLRALLIPILLGSLLLCIMLAGIVWMLTPEGLNPIEGLSLRAYLLRYDEELHTPYGTDPELRRFEVTAAEDSASAIGIKLVTQGFIGNGSLFARYVRYEGLDTQLQQGTFFISETMTIPEIARVLTDPAPPRVRFLVREGWRLEQIADAIDQNPQIPFSGNDFLAVAGSGAPIPLDFKAKYSIPDGASLEGFLFPATYEILLDETALGFRNQMLQAFDRNVTDPMIQDAALAGLNMYEVVTLASIVEREAVIADERPIIADVYLNRLEIDMKLDADPTTQYAIGNTRDGNWWATITQADYQLVDAYNTYVNIGLPPGPIASPGIASIRAVVYPADTPYFFFRAACDGSGAHDFSITYEEHLGKSC